MTTRAKFRCMSVTRSYQHTDGAGKDHFANEIRLLPVMAPKGKSYNLPTENAEFYAATPSGEIELKIVRDEAAAVFRPGACYYVDFAEAPE